jgi:hypothetical protein
MNEYMTESQIEHLILEEIEFHESEMAIRVSEKRKEKIVKKMKKKSYIKYLVADLDKDGFDADEKRMEISCEIKDKILKSKLNDLV